MENIDRMKNIVALSKRRGFAYPGSDIYGGFANSYTYGPYGVELKKNIKDLWWKTFVQKRSNMFGIDGDIILHPRIWEASGHLQNFSDQMVDCKDCKARLRADHLLEEQADIDAEGMEDSVLTGLIQKHSIHCSACKGKNLTDVRKFNLMFQTEMAKTSEGSIAYLRPETAQAIFVEFKNIVDTQRCKLPFGIAQIGKAFRNEITPGNFIFRRLEFEQMEIEYFVREDQWEESFDQWYSDMNDWCRLIGLHPDNFHLYEHPTEKLSHYSKRTVDIEYDYPFGRKELYGLAYRTNFDLVQHEKHSKQSLLFFDEERKEKIHPHVIEPSFGLDRTVLAVLCEAYTHESVSDSEDRIVLKFEPCVAPVKIAVLPLMKKDGLSEIAETVFDQVSFFGNCELDVSGSIGKRYRRQDEIGTPVCLTIDYETKENNTVTVRDRDTMQQIRVSISELNTYLTQNYSF